jgi:thiol-disulfide isomerase/thioredoxin
VAAALVAVHAALPGLASAGERAGDRTVTLLAETSLLERLTQGPMRRFRFGDAARVLPSVAFSGGGGEQVSLARFRGKVVLLAFWASWCAPCQSEIPSLERLQTRLSAKGLEVVAVSIDKKASAAAEAFAGWGVRGLTSLHDEGAAAARSLDVPGVPITLLIDPQGREIGRLRGSAIWDSVEAILLTEAVIRALIPQASVSGQTGTD